MPNLRPLALAALLLPLLLGGTARADDEIEEAGAQAKVQTLLGRPLTDDPREVWQLSRELAKLGRPAVRALGEALGEAPAAQGLAIARALVLLEDFTRGLEAVRKLAADEKAPIPLRVAALRIVAEEGDIDEADWLVGQLDAVFEPEVKLAMARALWQLNRESKGKGKEVMLTFLRSTDPDLRAQGALALGEIGAAGEAKAVLAQLREEPSERGRTAGLLLRLLHLEEQREQDLRNAPPLPAPTLPTSPLPVGGTWPLLDEIRTKLQQAYIDAGKVKAGDLEDAAAQGIGSALDPHTEYLDLKESARLLESLDPSYGGVGAYVQNDPGNNDAFTISRPIFGGPIDRAGLRSGDVVTAVDGTTTEGCAVDECVRRLKGPAGTKVVLTVFRRGWTETKDIPLTRSRITVPTTAFDILPGRVGFLQIVSFSEETAAEVAKVLDSFEQEKLVGLVIDLRSNGGGLLKSAVDIASELLPAGLPVVSEKGRAGVWPARNYGSTGAGAHRTHVMSVPKVVLINQFTASAAEILAGALQVHGRARLVGQMSYGKGTVQVPLELESRPGETWKDVEQVGPQGIKLPPNGRFDPPERFTDANGNGVWDDGEAFLDGNRNGRYDAGETYEDRNRNGRWDPGASLKMTVAEYFLPDGRNLRRETKVVDDKVVPTGGLEPEVKPPARTFDLWELQAQNQLEKTDVVRKFVQGLFEKDHELMIKLARSDRHDPEAYPGFDAFFGSLDTKLGKQAVRWLLRWHTRRQVGDELRRELVGDVVDDEVLQAGVRDLFKSLGRDLAGEADLAFLATLPAAPAPAATR
jgi:carboxyl-terminal processing protease